MTETLTGTILTPAGWTRGEIAFADRIERISGDAATAPEPPWLIPGFVDAHVHGGGGADMMDGAGAIRTAAALHARHGTTTLLATSVTAPIGATEAFLAAVAEVAAEPPEGRARVPAAHCEGPFINPDKLGAQPPHAIPADPGLMARWLDIAPVRVVTLAPEMDEGDRLRDMLLARGVRVQVAHALCDYAAAARAIHAGCGVTHLFNAMTGVAHRGNGIAGAALAHARYAEIIPDLIHVEPGAILAARRAIPNLYGVTDATGGAGMPDGHYTLGAHKVTKQGGSMRLADGTLAGSALTMDRALRNLVSIGLPLDEAARRLSTIPADWLGMPDAGRLSPGARADIVTLDADLNVTEVRIGGRAI